MTTSCRRLRIPVGIASLLGLAGSGFAQGEPHASVELVDGGLRSGVIRLVPGDGGRGPIVRVVPPEDATGTAEDLPLDGLARIEFEGLSAIDARGRSRLVMRNGDRLVGDLRSIDDSMVTVERPSGRQRIDRRRVLAIVSDGSVEELEQRVDEAVADPPSTDDVLFAVGRSGALQRLTVRVLAVANGQVRVRFRDQEQELPLDRCAALVFGSDRGLAAEEPPRPFVRVGLRDGSRVTGRAAPRPDDRATAFRIAIESGDDLVFDVTDLHRVEIASSRILRLHDREPEAVELLAAIDEEPVWRRGATALGDGLRLGGQVFDRGFGLEPFTRLEFAVPAGSFDRFRTTIGIDDRSRGPAVAIARIRFDGEIAGEWTVSGRSDPIEVSIPIPVGVVKVALEADFGPFLDLGDHCVFIDPHLKRGS